MLSQAVFLIDIVCGTRAPSSVDSDQRKDELQYFDERRMRASATFTSCAVCAYLFFLYSILRHRVPATPEHHASPGLWQFSNQSAVLFFITPQILPQWEGHAGDEVWLGTTTCLKLIFTQTAQDKPFWLFFLGILTEYWNRPSASRWKSGSLKRGFRRHPLKYSFSTNGRISWISLSLKLVGRHQTIFNKFCLNFNNNNFLFFDNHVNEDFLTCSRTFTAALGFGSCR